MGFEKAVVFSCGNEEYAVPVDLVVSIEKLERVTPIPHLPNYLLGFTRIRGELTPVIDFEVPPVAAQAKAVLEVEKYESEIRKAKERLPMLEAEKKSILLKYLKG